jgi:two-component system, sensor histidine kinase and response regulator
VKALIAGGVEIGEIAQCKAAGMDDALGKPIQIGVLGAALRHWIARGQAQAADSNQEVSAFDAGVLARAVGDNAQALAGIRSAYLWRSRQDLHEMQRNIDSSRWAEASAVASRWKSASRTVGAIALAQRLHAIEQVCRDGGVEMHSGIAVELRADLEAVERWLTRESVS